MTAKKIIVILGQTASGKSEMAVRLAKKFKGEIVSADSRQVYRKMDIGTGKITQKEMKGVHHCLLNIANPKRRFTVAQYRKLAIRAIKAILKKEKTPILCGGTGFYIQAIIDGIILPEVKPDQRLRLSLNKLKAEELFEKLKKLDPRRAKTIEKKNKRRLIRALEIIIKTKKAVPKLKSKPLPYPVLIIGIKREKEELRKLIEKRFFKWLKQGLIKEVENLRRLGLSWKRVEEFGLHYFQVSQYLQKKITYQKMTENSLRELNNYAKSQLTWFKRDKKIIWVKDYKTAEKLTKKFLR
ncbi:MAG: tRNA (adenosine(37)-N6)-dimethylallyltransferase MiaA [bacterium]